MNVKVVCTTDDPTDTLEHHLRLKADRAFAVKVRPAFRPDKALGVESPRDFNTWIERLEASAGLDVEHFDSFLEAIRRRHDFFHQAGCRLSDHGIEHPFAADFTAKDVDKAFQKARQGKRPTAVEALKYKSAVRLELARMDAEKGWTQQFHFGALRSINSKALATLGPDTGYDTIGDLDEVAVRNGREHLFAQPFGPKQGAFLLAGGTERSAATRVWDQVAQAARPTPGAGETAFDDPQVRKARSTRSTTGRSGPCALANRSWYTRRNSSRCCSTRRKSGVSRARHGL